MGERNRVDRYLEPMENTGVYSIGAYTSDLNSHGLILAGVKRLRTKSQKLAASEHPVDISAVTGINEKFAKNDFSAAARKLDPITDRPVDKNIVEWMAHGSDHDLEQFCEWSIVRLWHLTQALRRDQPRFINNVHSKAEDLTKVGVLPKNALPVIRAATDRYELYGMDAFYSGGRHFEAMTGDESIIVSNMYRIPRFTLMPSNEMKYAMFHEYMHAAGRDRGYFTGIKQKSPVWMRILEEGFVEHTTTVAHAPYFRQPLVIDPDKRAPATMGKEFYREERTFMAKLMEHTGISWEQLSEAYFLPRGDERGELLREDIEQRIGRFFGSLEAFYEFHTHYENASLPGRRNILRSTMADLTVPDVA